MKSMTLKRITVSSSSNSVGDSYSSQNRIPNLPRILSTDNNDRSDIVKRSQYKSFLPPQNLSSSSELLMKQNSYSQNISNYHNNNESTSIFFHNLPKQSTQLGKISQEQPSSNHQDDSALTSSTNDTIRINNMLKVKKFFRKNQLKVFLLSYLANFVCLQGFTIEFITTTFQTHQDLSVDLEYADTQVILLGSAVMYFLIGSSLEYCKRSDILILLVMFVFAVLKIATGAFDLFCGHGEHIFQYESIQIVHIVLGMRLAVFTIFIVGLAKWFSRIHFPLVFGLWISNEYLSYKLSVALSSYQDHVLIFSGFLLIMISFIIFKFYKLDPLDARLIVNEQAINLTTRRINNVGTVLLAEDFLEQFHEQVSLELNHHHTMLLNNPNITHMTMKKLDTLSSTDEESILKRWHSPTLIQTFKQPGFIKILICTCAIFFKYRITNKKVILNVINAAKADEFKFFDCFLCASILYQIIFGLCIIKWFRGRRFFIQFSLLALILTIEFVQVVIDFAQSHELSDTAKNLYAFQGQLIYTLYYTICFLAPIDLAKIAMLKENKKFTALFLGIMCSCQALLQAIFFDVIIYFVIDPNTYIDPNTHASKQSYYLIIKSVEIVCTVIAMVSIFSGLKLELREISLIMKSQKDNDKRIKMMIYNSQLSMASTNTFTNQYKSVSIKN